ncbi:formate dehydrogenase accessory sulfurtransferase FdhD [Desulfovibrio desulfuricans]|uniref:formate dehydrogenase accessory sulfurtransferase FdhD n=1 Tax=Desulfovibrio desulfuricans TaxID=876 RepID=UPI0003B635E8|nr:formate dehydrogenase accessory sulfurtransferase FdhD [Desulfovibrio desulfuricans]QTO39422.1 formate dehydrogenase accessory sulfurtransferase FdhD [Desulfovibrio desulfuricans]
MALFKNLTAGDVLPLASPPATVRSYDILTYSNGKVAPSVFLSCREQTLTMHVNGVPFVRVACSGQHLRYLVPGFLYSCGLIESLHDLAGVDVTPLPAVASGAMPPDGAEEVRVDVLLRGACCSKAAGSTEQAAPRLTITSAMGWNIPLAARKLRRMPRAEVPSWEPRVILRAAQELEERSEVFHQTGGCHNAALLNRQGMVFYCLDIGRHNAIDTLVGYMLVEGLNPADHMIISSGRIASEIAQKAVRAGVPVFASLSRAMSRAVDMARANGLTLLGNVKSGSMHIYHENGQLVLP